jgi:S1-C subfamily serine protease
VNLLDLLIALSVVSAVVGGYRLGFLARVTSWIGLAIGIVVGVRFLPSVSTYFQDAEPGVQVLAAIAFLLAAGMLGQGLGLAVGAALHASLRVGPGMRQYDKVAGSVLGAVGILAIFWMLTPSLATVPGWTSKAAKDSLVLEVLAKVTPKPPSALLDLRRLLADGFPQVFEDPNDSQHAPGPPPASSGITDAVHQRVVASTVKIAGQACRKVQEGSGFVAAPGLVVTNAHVVAGEDDTTVQAIDGTEHPAEVVAFDHRRDLAVLSVPSLERTPLALGEGTEGMRGAVYGHPGGQEAVAVSPAQISQQVRAVGRDIYDAERTSRQVFILAAHLRPGDSGGALVNQEGTVVGVAFAIAPDNPNTAYALTNGELRPVLDAAGARTEPVSTGPCLV